MKTNELRVGNMVYNVFDNVLIIRSINPYFENPYITGVLTFLPSGVPSGFSPMDKIKPIPLTTDILLKSGFELQLALNSTQTEQYSLNGIVIREFQVEVFEGDYDECVTFAMPNYVHQLQNLYFTLTGEELKIVL
jgi:hypothetical protein